VVVGAVVVADAGEPAAGGVAVVGEMAVVEAGVLDDAEVVVCALPAVGCGLVEAAV
jgi:hypothetical protein